MCRSSASSSNRCSSSFTGGRKDSSEQRKRWSAVSLRGQDRATRRHPDFVATNRDAHGAAPFRRLRKRRPEWECGAAGVGAPMLCLCTTLGQDGLTARLLVVRGERLERRSELARNRDGSESAGIIVARQRVSLGACRAGRFVVRGGDGRLETSVAWGRSVLACCASSGLFGASRPGVVVWGGVIASVARSVMAKRGIAGRRG